jgi:hypothetical protein
MPVASLAARLPDLTEEVLSALDPERLLSDVASDLEEIGYPRSARD